MKAQQEQIVTERFFILKKSRKIKPERSGKGTKDRIVNRSVLIYLILVAVLIPLLWLKPVQDIIDYNGFYTQTLVTLTSKIIEMTNIPYTLQGSIIQLPSISLDVEFGCNGIDAVMVYIIAVMAFPATWKKRIVGMIAGFFLIQTINILRISSLAYLGFYHKDVFELIHLYLAQGMMIAFDFIILLAYLYYAGRERKCLVREC